MSQAQQAQARALSAQRTRSAGPTPQSPRSGASSSKPQPPRSQSIVARAPSQNQDPNQLPTRSSAPSQSAASQAHIATVQAVLDGESNRLPRIHYYTYKGDVVGVERTLNEGADVNATVPLPNEFNQMVHGVTALYLAAQYGFIEIAQLLIAHGADPQQKCWIPNTSYEFSPSESALLHLNLKLWRFINSSVAAGPRTPAQDRARQRRAMSERHKAYLIDEPVTVV